jgi:tetratricopeptide (TPR) repeat protein
MLLSRRYDEAQSMVQTAQQLQRGFTPRSPASVLISYRQGALDIRRGLYAEAKASLERAINAGQLHAACKNILRCAIMTEIAFAELGLRRIDRARDAVSASQIALASSEAQLAGNASDKHRQAILSYVAAKAGRHSRLMRRFVETIIPHAWMHQTRDALHPVRERMLLLEAHVLLETGHIAKAVEAFERVINIYRDDDKLVARTTGHHPVIADCHSGLALCALARGDYPDAESLFIKAKEGKFAGGWEATSSSMAMDTEGLAFLDMLFAR